MVLDPSVICCDYQSYVRLSENQAFHDKSRHIEIKYFRNLVFDGAVELQYDGQIADILTKALS